MSDHGRPRFRTVEELLRHVESWPPESDAAELWVPEELTLHGDPVPRDVAMAIVSDKLLSLGYFPNGYSAGAGGRLHRYKRE